MKYKYIEDLTSDVMFESYGKDLKELFENSALAVSEIICKIKKIKHQKTLKVEVNAKNPQELLFNWLQQIIAEVDINEMFFSEFNISEISETSLKAEIKGQEIQPELGETVVKSVTNHNFTLTKTEKGYKATAVLDI